MPIKLLDDLSIIGGYQYKTKVSFRTGTHQHEDKFLYYTGFYRILCLDAPDQDKIFGLHTDASDAAIGAILHQTTCRVILPSNSMISDGFEVHKTAH